MSSMTARLQAMIVTLDDMLEPESQGLELTTSPCRLTLGKGATDRTDADTIRAWVNAFFSHPERIQIKQFKVVTK